MCVFVGRAWNQVIGPLAIPLYKRRLLQVGERSIEFIPNIILYFSQFLPGRCSIAFMTNHTPSKTFFVSSIGNLFTK